VVQADADAPTTLATLTPAPNAEGWISSVDGVYVELVASDDAGGSGVAELAYQMYGAETRAPDVVAGNRALLHVTAEGDTVVEFFARDAAGNVEPVRTVHVRLDSHAPLVACTATPEILWPPSGHLAPVSVAVSASDGISGTGPLTLRSVIADEPLQSTDISGFALGSGDTSGALRAARSGSGDGRVYLFEYEVTDLAGNSASCRTTATVPHDARER
jgi:hypothetical protein